MKVACLPIPRWVEGLASGLVLPIELTDRLAMEKPKMASIATATRSDLSAVLT
jgi:hypothetical protein